MDKIYLLLGSNLGERETSLETALKRLESISEIDILKTSAMYNSPAMEMNEPAPDFLNQAIEIETQLTPTQLLHKLKEIEVEMGRTGKGNYQSRKIDIDILLYGDMIINSAELTVPQARMLKRPFALIPLEEIAPELIHPSTNEKISNYINPPDRNIVTKIEEHAAASS